MPKAVPVAVTDDPRLHERAASGHRDGACIVVTQVEMPLQPHKASPPAALSMEDERRRKNTSQRLIRNSEGDGQESTAASTGDPAILNHHSSALDIGANTSLKPSKCWCSHAQCNNAPCKLLFPMSAMNGLLSIPPASSDITSGRVKDPQRTRGRCLGAAPQAA